MAVGGSFFKTDPRKRRGPFSRVFQVGPDKSVCNREFL